MSLPPHDPLLNARRAGYTRRGFGGQYHAHRPKPPAALVDLLLQVAGTRRPRLVADLGSGTGISTTIGAPHAERVIGIEPLRRCGRSPRPATLPRAEDGAVREFLAGESAGREA
jgi:predicted O-methyltransferase YrrM